MKQKSCEGLHWMQFDLLSDIPKVTHAVFTRHGGVSKGPFESLNFSCKVGDIRENVAANLESVKRVLDISSIILGRLVHGVTIAEVNSAGNIHEQTCDGLMTKALDIGMMITHADCQAAIFYDPIHHVAANVHSGWRGSVYNIYKQTVHAMQRAYGTKPRELLVCISPSLGPEDSEFVNFRTELPVSFWDYQIKPFYFDFWAISRFQLQECGILPHHIEIASVSTYSNTHQFFSYRREKETGRNGTVIVLR